MSMMGTIARMTQEYDIVVLATAADSSHLRVLRRFKGDVPTLLATSGGDLTRAIYAGAQRDDGSFVIGEMMPTIG